MVGQTPIVAIFRIIKSDFLGIFRNSKLFLPSKLKW